jgi:hypothetical protein
MITITKDNLGPAGQPVIPAGQMASIEAGTVSLYTFTGMAENRACALRSAAEEADLDQYRAKVNMDNGLLFVSPYDGPSVATLLVLSMAANQEWMNNPASGHNKALS